MDIANYFLTSLLSSWIYIAIVALLFFLLIREIVTWYWKLNRIVDILEQIEKNTRKEKVFSAAETTPRV